MSEYLVNGQKIALLCLQPFRQFNPLCNFMTQRKKICNDRKYTVNKHMLNVYYLPGWINKQARVAHLGNIPGPGSSSLGDPPMNGKRGAEREGGPERELPCWERK